MKTKVTRRKKLKDLRSSDTGVTMGNICSNLNNKAKKVWSRVLVQIWMGSLFVYS